MEILIVIAVCLFVAIIAIPVCAIIYIGHIVDHNKHGSPPETDWQEGLDD
jgi:hypothetical protein